METNWISTLWMLLNEMEPFSIKSVDQFNFEPTGTHKIYTHPRYEIAAKIYYLDLIPSLLWSISNTFYVTHWWNIQKINNVLANEFHCLFLLVICTVWIKTKQCKYVDWCFFVVILDVRDVNLMQTITLAANLHASLASCQNTCYWDIAEYILLLLLLEFIGNLLFDDNRHFDTSIDTPANFDDALQLLTHFFLLPCPFQLRKISSHAPHSIATFCWPFKMVVFCI